jgi:long-chain acyl-CoA synthetase
MLVISINKGMWDELGRLKIIDRAKNIFKLAQGEYIAPEKIEGVYGKHELVAQMFCYGDSLKPQLVAIVVPDKEVFEKWAKEQNFPGEYKEQVANETVVAAFFKEINAFARSSDLKGFECVRAISLESELFSVENELLTPTFKLKRHEAKKKYLATIEGLYAKLEDK